MDLTDLKISINLDTAALAEAGKKASLGLSTFAERISSATYEPRSDVMVIDEPWSTKITIPTEDFMTHRAHTAEMVITDHGIAKFLPETLSEEAKKDLIGDGKNPRIRNDNLKSFPVGTFITAQFRIGAAGKRILISARKVVDTGAGSMITEKGGIYSAAAMKEPSEAGESTSTLGKDDMTSRFGKFVEDTAATAFYDDEGFLPSEQKPIQTNGFYVSPETALAYSTAATLLDLHPGVVVKTLMVGESGYGKTTTPRMFAKKRGMDFYRMNCASIRDPEEWFGYREAVDGTTIFVESDFIKKLVAGNIVMIFDEFNRLEPFLHNTLYPLLDDDQATTIYGKHFKIGPNTLIVATINTGSKFTGTFQLDAANLRRFNLFCEVGPMPADAEIDVLVTRTGVDKKFAKDIVTVAASLRQIEGVECSTGTTLEIARIVNAGIKIRDAFQVVVVMRTENPEDINNNPRKLALDVINVKLGHFTFDASTYSFFDGVSYS